VAVIGLDAVGKPMDERWVFRHTLYADITGVGHGKPVKAASIAKAILHEKGMLKGFPAHSSKLLFLNKADLPGGLEAAEEITALLSHQGKTGLHRVIVGNALHQPPVVAYYGDLKK
jgi:probable selenium-dependent hydroxylase accessory protein YqeC